MSEIALWSLSASELVAGYRAGDFSPGEALQAVLGRMEAVNPAIKAVIACDAAGASAAAAASTERWRAGAPLSALDGVPLTVKDNLFVKGLCASWGSRAYEGFAPDADESAVARLRAGGAVIFGKTNVPEFTLQGYTGNALFGTTRNPHALDRTPGGSTGGGAAAVAAGIGALAIGTDGGGSLRRPAAHCGLFALKPSIGQVARHGGFPAILADFEVVGPLGRSVADIAAAFELLCGYHPGDPRSLAALAPRRQLSSPPRIGYFRRVGAAPVDPGITVAADAFAKALARDGCAIEPIEAPFDLEAINTAWGTVAATGLAWHLDKRPDLQGRLGANALAIAETGRGKTTGQYLDALAFTGLVRTEAAATFERFDLLLCPATAALAWPAAEAFPPFIDGQPVGPRGHAVFTGWMNIAGVPAATLHIGMTGDSGGIGMQLVAGHGRDRALLEFMRNAPAIRALGTAGLTEGLPAS